MPTSLLDAVTYWTMRTCMQNIDELHEQPENLAIAILSIIAKEWLTVKEYMSTRLNQIEWELQIPDFRGNGKFYGLGATLKRLHPFRRHLPVYRKWVLGVLDNILNKEKVLSNDLKERPLAQLREDFLKVLNEIEAIEKRVQDMLNVVTAIISIEEAKRSVEQTSSLARLTYLAVVFVPLSFVSSFLSMTPDVESLRGTIWLFFVLAVPLTIFALSVALWVHIKDWWFSKRRRRSF
ncbi:hypothetical protein O181_023654 [Austropuccinia psidii MF-1]|uniref:Uncharacterized protein n=1 Tax=Austropuccinia psidii MF-1 TaxID=1389203 RepID=A0A9Q3GYW0_9BASI|nr:hypothetical protein [Austropuccinia psidii MF-1]